MKRAFGIAFKKYIIKNSDGARPEARVLPVFFEPFQKNHAKANYLLKKGEKCDAITLKRMDEAWRDVYHRLKPILEFIYIGQL